MKRTVSLFLSCLMMFLLAACGNSAGTGDTAAVSESGGSPEPERQSGSEISVNGDSQAASDMEAADTDRDTEDTDSHILVAYFSLAGEQYQVGVVEEGNTSIIAQMIAEQTGADLFRIEAAEPYPETYDGLLEVSREEMEGDTRPEIVGTVENMGDYDTVFIGFPIWWGELPMIVRGFLESYDFGGKTVIPFCTHGGSGLSGTEKTIEDICAGAELADGLAISGETAQNDRDTADERVAEWLKEGCFRE